AVSGATAGSARCCRPTSSRTEATVGRLERATSHTDDRRTSHRQTEPWSVRPASEAGRWRPAGGSPSVGSAGGDALGGGPPSAEPPPIALSAPVALSAPAVWSGPPRQIRTHRHDPGRVDLVVSGVVVPLDVIEVHRVAEARSRVEIPGVRPQHRHLGEL